MVVFNRLFLTSLAAITALASATSDGESFSLEQRSGRVHVTDVSMKQLYTCNGGDKNEGQRWGIVSQDRAEGYFRDAKTKTGKSGYPKPFGNAGKVMKFPSGCAKDVWELPLLPNEPPFNGRPFDFNQKKENNDPGQIRVYYTKDLKFCGIGAKRTANKQERGNNPHNCATN
ncbi:unnamed protein product [Clonostachys solani]|uniref:Uncharacterized protein n=1 Tax=Clonostachys solani TaxID=160281 RepID=A0A9N9ZFU1_9HYPO|nr:unnamed protein product [Clonostachys solani]